LGLQSSYIAYRRKGCKKQMLYRKNFLQSLRNIRKYGTEKLPKIIIFLRNPYFNECSDETFEIYEDLINNKLILDINNTIKSYKKKLIETCEKFFSDQIANEKFKSIKLIKQIPKINCSKYYVTYHKKSFNLRKATYLRMQKTEN
jgi:hypothetical protein